MTDAPKRQIDSLQAGRALAALYVVAHHSTLATNNFTGAAINAPILGAGYLGVDFFFVLSGFIIYHSSQNKSLGQYAFARIRRVYFPYLPIGIALALLYTVLPAVSAGDRSWSWLPTLTLLPVNSPTALSVAWTLKHEILFYAVFACLFFTRLLPIGLLMWAVAIGIAAFVEMEDNIPLALINLEFVFGIGVAVAYKRGWGHPAWSLAAFPPFALWLWLGANREYSVLVGLALAILMLPIIRLEARGRFRVPKWLLFLGAASYSIYLAHQLAISVVVRVTSGLHWSAVLLSCAMAGVAVGTVYYLIVERQLLRLVWFPSLSERPYSGSPAK